MSGAINLADGRRVPAAAVAALDELEHTWPGATTPQARPAIAAAVIAALDSENAPLERKVRRIAAILQRHKAPRGFCSCGEWYWTHRGEVPWERHVAEEIAELMSTPLALA